MSKTEKIPGRLALVRTLDKMEGSLPEEYQSYPDVRDLIHLAVSRALEKNFEAVMGDVLDTIWESIEKESLDLVDKGHLEMCADPDGEIYFRAKDKGKRGNSHGDLGEA